MYSMKMDIRMFVVVLCFYMIDCNRIKKLERGITILRDRFSSLEEKVYDDALELRNEMENMRLLFNASNENGNHVANTEDADSSDTNAYKNIGADEILRKIEDRSRTMLGSFAKEKAMIRDYIEKFENDLEEIRKQQNEALSDLKNASYKLSIEMNNTLNDEVRKTNTMIEQLVANMTQKQTYEFVELSRNIKERFATHEDVSLQQNKRSMESLELSFDRMKVKQENNLDSFMMETNQMITSFKVTFDEQQEKARISQELATSKALEFESLIDKVKDMSNECTKKTDSMQQSVRFIANVALTDLKKFENSFYILSTHKVDRSKAGDECTKIGASLVDLDSYAETLFLAQMTKAFPVWYRITDIKNSWFWHISPNCLVDSSSIPNYRSVRCKDKNHYACEYKLVE